MKGMYNKKITNHATIEYEVERVVERLKKEGKKVTSIKYANDGAGNRAVNIFYEVV